MIVRKQAVAPTRGQRARAPSFKRGDVVEWNSEAGRVRGVILKKVSNGTGDFEIAIPHGHILVNLIVFTSLLHSARIYRLRLDP